MNACMLAYTFYESDNRVMRYAETLARRGDIVDVISLRRPGESARVRINGVNVLRVQRRTKGEQAKLVYLAKLVSFFLISMVVLSVRHWRRPYDLVHVHNVPDFLVCAAWFPKWTGAKLILDIHDVLPEFYANKFKCTDQSWIFRALVWTERLSVHFADHVILANHLWLERVVKRSAAAGKCSVELNYPDTSVFRPRGRGPKNEKFVIIFPGSLNFHQGLDIAIRAFARFREQVPLAEFHIYGEGGEKANLQELVRSLSLESQVHFLGVTPLREVAKVMENADLGVVPKRADSFGNEAFSTKILEFMCLRVPVVVSSTRVDRYYFNPAVVKFFDSGNTESMALAMLSLAHDPDLREQLAGRAFHFVQRFTWEQNQSLYLDLVDSLVSGCFRTCAPVQRVPPALWCEAPPPFQPSPSNSAPEASHERCELLQP